MTMRQFDQAILILSFMAYNKSELSGDELRWMFNKATVDAQEKGYRKLCQICKDLCIILGFKALSF